MHLYIHISKTAHIHFPHMVLSEVRVQVVVPLLGWLVGNAVTNVVEGSYHMTVDRNFS